MQEFDSECSHRRRLDFKLDCRAWFQMIIANLGF